MVAGNAPRRFDARLACVGLGHTVRFLLVKFDQRGDQCTGPFAFGLQSRRVVDAGVNQAQAALV